MNNTAAHSSHSTQAHHCFHCGLPVDESTHDYLMVFGDQQYFCCHGCKAVCKTIIDSGLEKYYQSREPGVSSNQQKNLQQILDKLTIYDNENVQKSFVQKCDNWREAYLILVGIRCSACIWLNELHLRRQPGVLDVHIDDITQRARVRWDPEKTTLSQILAAIINIGYQAYPYEPSHYLQLQKENKRKNLRRILFAAIIGMIPMHFALATWFLGGPNDQGEYEQWEQLGRWTSLLVTITLLLYPAQEFFFGVWSDFKREIIGMDVPIVLGLSCAFLLSAHSTVTGQGEVYYESIAMFILFILLSRRLEHQARIQASDQLERLALSQPQDANLVKQDGHIEMVSVKDLKPGQTIQILPGAQVPVDCEILTGQSSFNESLVSGESRAIDHQIGDRLMAGSVNYDQPVMARVKSTEMDSTIAEITRLAETGLQQKPAQSLLADRVASWFVIAILLVACLTSIYWWVQGNAQWLVITVSVLIVTCPCALALAVPITMTIGSSRLLRMGLLPLNMSIINKLEQADIFVFDKTGTLTIGKPRLVDIHWLVETDKSQALSVIKSLTSKSEHPVARALHDSIQGPVVVMENTINHIGLGLEGEKDGIWRFGRYEFVAEFIDQLTAEQKTTFNQIKQQHFSISCLSHGHHLVAFFQVEDRLREGNTEIMQQLHERGIQTVILSGDTEQSVQYFATILKVDHYLAEQSPQQKMEWVLSRQQAGHVVAMAGDGINDAPTLATADVSFSLSGSTALANNHSDLVLLGSNLQAIPLAISLAGKTLHRIRQNISWAIFYNLIAIPFTVTGLVPPWAAAIGMSLSSAIVVLNSVRLDKQSIE